MSKKYPTPLQVLQLSCKICYNYLMERFVAVLGRQPLISVAELESLFADVRLVAPNLAEFTSEKAPNIARLGGTLKLATPIDVSLEEFWQSLPENGKIVLGLSDFSRSTNPYLTQREALRWKKYIAKTGRNVRIIPNKTAILSSATSLHNKLFTDTHIELIKNGKRYYRVIAVQDIESYARRDQSRPARDAKVGMLPPKLAQILINLCGDLSQGTRLLDPFCGTGVVLQEAALMGYLPYGTDLSDRMVEYSARNLDWLYEIHARLLPSARNNVVTAQGDATSYTWQPPIDAVACETYLGPPMSLPPAEIKLKEAKQVCKSIVLGFLKNLSEQIETGTPVTIAVPAWLRPDGHYERLNLLDEIDKLRYNVVRFKNLGQKDLLYYRNGQVVAREIIVLRKK